ncbi:unnamed protein product [Closterium sp. NIES-54]
MDPAAPSPSGDRPATGAAGEAERRQRQRVKREVCDEVVRKLREARHPSAQASGFDANLLAHFNRLPTRYALDVNTERAEDVLTHKRLLEEAARLHGLPVFFVRAVRMAAAGGAAGAEEAGPHASMETDDHHPALPPHGALAPPAFGSSPNLEAPVPGGGHGAAGAMDDDRPTSLSAPYHNVPMHEVTFSTFDRPKLLSQLSAVLADAGLNIREAHVFSTSDGLSLDVFVVDGWPTEVCPRALAPSTASPMPSPPRLPIPSPLPLPMLSPLSLPMLSPLPLPMLSPLPLPMLSPLPLPMLSPLPLPMLSPLPLPMPSLLPLPMPSLLPLPMPSPLPLPMPSPLPLSMLSPLSLPFSSLPCPFPPCLIPPISSVPPSVSLCAPGMWGLGARAAGQSRPAPACSRSCLPMHPLAPHCTSLHLTAPHCTDAMWMHSLQPSPVPYLLQSHDAHTLPLCSPSSVHTHSLSIAGQMGAGAALSMQPEASGQSMQSMQSAPGPAGSESAGMGGAGAGGQGAGSHVSGAESRVPIPTDGRDDWEIDSQQLKLHHKIASGSFGDLYRGTYCGQDVAIKILKPERLNDSLQQEFAQEVYIMRKVRHKNVVQFIGACTKPPNLSIVTEFMVGGSVYDYIHKQRGSMRLGMVVRVGMDVAKGMDFLHKNNIIHRDLKAANLLMDENEVVKVADFGVARVKAGSGIMTAETGTYRWMAPEVIEHRAYDHKADVFSFAITLWELLTGKLPYADLTPLQAAVSVVQKGLRPPIPKGTHPRLAELMARCWHTNPAERPEFSAVLRLLADMAHEVRGKGMAHEVRGKGMAHEVRGKGMAHEVRGKGMAHEVRGKGMAHEVRVCRRVHFLPAPRCISLSPSAPLSIRPSLHPPLSPFAPLSICPSLHPPLSIRPSLHPPLSPSAPLHLPLHPCTPHYSNLPKESSASSQLSSSPPCATLPVVCPRACVTGWAAGGGGG